MGPGGLAAVGAVALALAACQGVPSGETAPSPVGAHSSWSGLHRCAAADAAAYRCGELSVALDRTQPGTRTLRLPVIVGGSAGATRTLLFLTGGPGQGGVAAGPTVIRRLSAIAETYRIVLIDQRGTGANALQCPQLQAEIGSADLEVPTPGAITTCAEQLGADRAHYATTDTVADLEDLRQALGAPAWSMDGVSYGTYVAQRYAAVHPDRIDRLVLDSVVPVRGFDPEMTDAYPEVARVLRAVCGSSCGGDPAGDLATAITRSPDLGPLLLDTLSTMSVADPSFAEILPTIHPAATGHEEPMRAVLGQWRNHDHTPADSLSQGLHASTLCLDIDFPWGSADTPTTGRAVAADRSVAALTAAQLWPFTALTARHNGEMTTCELWPRTPDPVVPQADLAAVGPRTLLLAGDRDLSTPLVWARAAAATLPGSRLVVVPAAGHSTQARGPASAGAEAMRFLLQP